MEIGGKAIEIKEKAMKIDEKAIEINEKAIKIDEKAIESIEKAMEIYEKVIEISEKAERPPAPTGPGAQKRYFLKGFLMKNDIVSVPATPGRLLRPAPALKIDAF